MEYNLELRLGNFSKKLLSFLRTIKQDNINAPIINQLVRSSTSIGANYCEADDAESRKDYIHKVGIAKKEARETAYWLKMIVVAEPKLKEEAMKIYQEAKELNLIMNAIVRKASIKTD